MPHKQVACPSETMSYDLLKKAGTKPVTSKISGKLEYIVSACATSKEITTASKRYHVTIQAKSTWLNGTEYIDFMYIGGVPVLDMVYDTMRFSAASFLGRFEMNLSGRPCLRLGQLFTQDC